MLIIFGGLPGVGKSKLARRIAEHLEATYLRVDTVEAVLADQGTPVGAAGYAIAYALAGDNLRLGQSVVADSVNLLEVTRQTWRELASRAGVGFTEVEGVRG